MYAINGLYILWNKYILCYVIAALPFIWFTHVFSFISFERVLNEICWLSVTCIVITIVQVTLIVVWV